MDIEKIISIAIFGSFSIFCFIKLIITLFKINKYDKVKGKVTFAKQDYFDAQKGSHNKYHFEYNNKVYDIEDKFFGGNSKAKVNDDVYFYVSKKNNDKYITPEQIYFLKYYFIGFIFGSLASIIF